ncbi:MAG: nucleotide exchange factor GrpE [Variibacter sp.]|nr:nucleotide exchange factor GrpE [Variibacter sp.]
MTDNGAHAPEAAKQDGEDVVETAPPSGAAAAETEKREKEAEAQSRDKQAEAQSGGQAVDVEALAKESAEFRDRWLRALAEMENLRRRTEREVADARTYGIASFARDMVGVADNMRRALAAVPPALRESAEAGIKSLIEGVELTDRELAKALEKHGVRRLEAQGQKFDPHVHQAMFEVEDPSVPAGTVVQVVQDGYTIGERVLRPALVGVAKGGPKAANGPANDNPDVQAGGKPEQDEASAPATGK